MLIHIYGVFYNLHTVRFPKSFGVNFSFWVQGHFKVISSVHNSGGGGGDFIPSLPGCVCPKLMDMGPFRAPSE